MIPLVDLHCHLLAGLDDGPRSDDVALAMCQIAYAEGTRWIAATAHQNEHWPDVTPDRIRAAVQCLSAQLRGAGLALTVFPCGEVMASPEMDSRWRRGELMSVADRGQYLLVEMPRGTFVDLRDLVQRMARIGKRVILAHPERHPELLHEPGAIEGLIEAGALVQVSTHSVTDPANRADERALRDWFRRGVVHVLGSDGHSTTRRPPKIATAYGVISRWAGAKVADRTASTCAMAVLQGLPLYVAKPERTVKRWFSPLLEALQ